MQSFRTGHLAEGFFGRWRYLILLIALLILLVVHPIVAGDGDGDGDSAPLFDVLFVVVMVTMTFALAQDKMWRVIACVVLLPAAVLSMGGHLLASTAQTATIAAGHAIGAIFFVAVAVKIVRSILASHDLSLDSIFGALCGYLLLGVAFALAHAMLYAGNPDSFQFGEQLTRQMNQAEFSRHIFIYYSFVTLTTVGYGDVIPLSVSARTLSWVEAMTGQLYLAVLVAGVVSSLVARKSIVVPEVDE